jgi:hypothetical protein
MKKITTFLTSILLLAATAVNAQYYFNSFPTAGQNPGGLNNDPEQPFGAAGVTAGDGYTSIIANGTTTLTWSATQTIPFAFDFNGSPVTQYKVSNTGVLTFTTSATTVPPTANATLPSASIPDKSVCVWGLQQFTGNDGVLSKTHGTAPNRQHWINFASFSAPGAAGTQWTYWGIVLEESTNNIYVVDLRTYQTPLTLTIGVQIDGTNAVQIASAPNTPSLVTNGGNASDPTDNAYYEFIYGTRPNYDVELSAFNVPDVSTNGSSVSFSGSLLNKGATTLDTVNLHWTADGGTTVNTQMLTGLSLASLSSYNFTHSTSWTPSNPGNMVTIEAWTTVPAGDQNTTNDTLSSSTFVINGTTVSRGVLLEEFSTAPCQFCPDGAVVVENILATNPSVIAVAEHACFGTDAMTIPEASTYCSAFGTGAPTACVDRILYDGESTVAFSRAGNQWANRSATRAGIGAPVNVTLGGTYNPTTKIASVDLTANFVDYVLPGDLRMTLFVVEDSVTGTGSGYDQVNYYNTVAGHPYAGAGNPIIGYVHKHVLRDVYPTTDAWGETGIIPTTPAVNNNYTKNYTFGLSSAWKEKDISLVGFVSYYNVDAGKREVLNATEIHLNLITGIEKNGSAKTQLNLYPNPSSQETTVEFNLIENSNVAVYVVDITGKELIRENLGTMVQGNHRTMLDVSNLAKGIYFVNISVNGNVTSKKLSVIK